MPGIFESARYILLAFDYPAIHLPLRLLNQYAENTLAVWISILIFDFAYVNMRISTTVIAQIAVGAFLVSASTVPTTNGHLSLARSRAETEPQVVVTEVGAVSPSEANAGSSTVRTVLGGILSFIQTMSTTSNRRPTLSCYCGSGVVCCEYPEGPACGYGICSV